MEMGDSGGMHIPEEEEKEGCWLGRAPLSPQWSLETKAGVRSPLGSPPFLDKGFQHPPPPGSGGRAGWMVRPQVTIITCRKRQLTVQGGS